MPKGLHCLVSEDINKRFNSIQRLLTIQLIIKMAIRLIIETTIRLITKTTIKLIIKMIIRIIIKMIIYLRVEFQMKITSACIIFSFVKESLL